MNLSVADTLEFQDIMDNPQLLDKMRLERNLSNDSLEFLRNELTPQQREKSIKEKKAYDIFS